jgi:hypothetical protein
MMRSTRPLGLARRGGTTSPDVFDIGHPRHVIMPM